MTKRQVKYLLAVVLMAVAGTFAAMVEHQFEKTDRLLGAGELLCLCLALFLAGILFGEIR